MDDSPLLWADERRPTLKQKIKSILFREHNKSLQEYAFAVAPNEAIIT